MSDNAQHIDDMDPTDGQPIARYYVPEHNPERRYLAGVPLRNITEAEFERYPLWLQQSIDALDFYRKTKPPAVTTKAERAGKE